MEPILQQPKNLEITIGPGVHVPPLPRNIYQLEMTLMHGDADHYTTLSYSFTKDEEEILKQHINICDWYLSMDSNSKCDTPILACPFYNGIAEEWFDGWPYDITSEHHKAQLDSYEVYYYDEHAVRHTTSITREEHERDRRH